MSITGVKSILFRTAIAAVNAEDHIRVYFQDIYGNILEAAYDGANWSKGTNVIGKARIGSPLAAVTKELKQISVFYVSDDNFVQETIYDDSTKNWSHGNLGAMQLEIPHYAKLAATVYPGHPKFYRSIYYQSKDDTINVYNSTDVGSEWEHETFFHRCLPGTSISAVSYIAKNRTTFKLYYQDPKLENIDWYRKIGGGWTTDYALGYGGVPRGAITSVAGQDGYNTNLRVFYTTYGQKISVKLYVGSRGWAEDLNPPTQPTIPGSEMAAITYGSGDETVNRIFFQHGAQMMAIYGLKPWGYRWRSSKTFVISTIVLALFAETFLYGFLVPILSYMLEVRLHIDPSRTQSLSSALLAIHGFVALISAPVIAHFADKTPNRRTPLLISLAACLIGTLLVALWTLFAGRILQGVAGSAAWIVGFATLVDNVGMEHMGKTMGVAMSFVMAGVIGGPAIAGSLLQLSGYWPTWSVPLGVIFCDIVARLVMIEGRDRYIKCPDSFDSASPSPVSTETTTTIRDDEEASLLASAGKNYQSVKNNEPVKGAKESIAPRGFYYTTLQDTRVLAGLASVVLMSSIVCGFDATLPLHLRHVFNWGSLPVGMTFLALQVPSIFLSPIVGWLRDRVGLRYPTAAGWALLVPLLWLMGVPGDSRFPWASPETNGKAIFISCIVGIGTATTLARGAGTVQLTAVVNDMQSKNPNIFGAHGGNSRVSSMMEVAFSLGMMVGPLLSGSLTELVGYYYMSVTLEALKWHPIIMEIP
ncbi:uncharacterized protein GIQ15_04564 [Arthroderma uncinatum]|uniref:uncharacterized protein n=1 Tax=Arthroderma uncinatum TaxID=74035 RepID=UPI00144AEEB0|nr:uncharacterized protein GIQ15_04564 [Arthroderma uncinatum]KAF3481805.1 hypothetical protein GIQ15_04564 [Arthroderma uncinatum]